jgi:predicted regulator of Ras-like GTPase activity (Roadblock/LC7/MglB family)
MKSPAPADLQRWSDEVARDPRSLAFLPLARAYRRQGLRDAAKQLCLRGLEAYPSHVEAHGLLALIYLEGGDSQKAADEWSMVLRIDPDNFDALRGMGFVSLEQDHLSRARQMLERAALMRPADTAVQEALRVLGTRQELAEEGLSRKHASGSDNPWGNTGERDAHVAAPSATPTFIAAEPPAFAAPVEIPAAVVSAALPSDPNAIFDELLSSGPLLGALLVDSQGLVLAGRLIDGVEADSALLGAVLGGATGEAARTVTHLELGAWRGILIEAQTAILHIAPAAGDAVVVIAARRNAPAGWILRAAMAAAETAGRFLEEYA